MRGRECFGHSANCKARERRVKRSSEVAEVVLGDDFVVVFGQLGIKLSR